MEFLVKIFEEEINNSKNMLKQYKEELNKLPKGSLSKKCIRGHMYYYLQYRENHKLVSKYLGKLAKEDVIYYKSIDKRRKQLSANLKKVHNQVQVLRRLLNDKKIRSSAYLSYTYLMNIQVPIDDIINIAKRYRLKEIALFGSVLTKEFRTDSDIDVLVEFLPQTKPTLYDLVEIKTELESIFKRKVDVVEKTGLRNPFRKKAILEQVEVLYAA